MTFVIDNNIGLGVAQGMRCFGEDVTHLTEHFREDMPDPEWLAEVGQRGWFVLTRDNRIRSRTNERIAVKRYSVGVFFLAGKSQTTCQIIQQLIRNWPRIKDYARNHNPPFAIRIPPSGTKLTKLVPGEVTEVGLA